MFIKRLYEIDPLACPEGGQTKVGQMKVITFIEPPQGEVFETVLRGHQSGATISGLWHASRAPLGDDEWGPRPGRRFGPPDGRFRRESGNGCSWTSTRSKRPSHLPRRPSARGRYALAGICSRLAVSSAEKSPYETPRKVSRAGRVHQFPRLDSLSWRKEKSDHQACPSVSCVPSRSVPGIIGASGRCPFTLPVQGIDR